MLGDPRDEEVVATRGSQIPPHRTQVPDVLDRRRPETRRRVGTRMSQRDESEGDGGREGEEGTVQTTGLEEAESQRARARLRVIGFLHLILNTPPNAITLYTEYGVFLSLEYLSDLKLIRS
ncbi:hypothetical protein PIB30_000149 [Stylosanthes scabra]|uniref:Uncharacterized protein n=1 Tax=Stylosanthes scabra TaxID=79078 RepID=A0ABU6R2R8_9FABA|nr:hypothetical protein [Stylosanthes scabra]